LFRPINFNIKKKLIKNTINIDAADKMNEKIRCRYDADIIKGAMRSKEKGL